MKALLGREDVNLDKPDNNDRTPLSFTAQDGYEGVVKILLGWEEVGPGKRDNNVRTPFLYAARG